MVQSANLEEPPGVLGGRLWAVKCLLKIYMHAHTGKHVFAYMCVCIQNIFIRSSMMLVHQTDRRSAINSQWLINDTNQSRSNNHVSITDWWDSKVTRFSIIDNTTPSLPLCTVTACHLRNRGQYMRKNVLYSFVDQINRGRVWSINVHSRERVLKVFSFQSECGRVLEKDFWASFR